MENNTRPIKQAAPLILIWSFYSRTSGGGAVKELAESGSARKIAINWKYM